MAAALCLALAGCDRLGIGVTPIGDITKAPASFEAKDVVLRGKVTESNKIPLLNVTIYTLQDDTGQIPVITTQSPPPVGETLTVHGKVENAAILGGRGFGVTVAERSRR
jgi:hypothetical protein